MNDLPEPHRIVGDVRKFRDPVSDLIALAVKVDDPVNLERDAAKRCATIARLARAVAAQRKGVIGDEAIADGLMPICMLVYAVDCFEKGVSMQEWRKEGLDALARAERRAPVVHAKLRAYFHRGIEAVHGLRNPRSINPATVKLALEPLMSGLCDADPAFAFRNEAANQILPRIRQTLAEMEPKDHTNMVRRIV